jgi:hypothetical protein
LVKLVALSVGQRFTLQTPISFSEDEMEHWIGVPPGGLSKVLVFAIDSSNSRVLPLDDLHKEFPEVGTKHRFELIECLEVVER